MSKRKILILAGGTGSRLWPITQRLSKQLKPIYDKPMIYYQLSGLMLTGIREIGVITTPQDRAQFQNLLGDGTQWGVQISWMVQPGPDGLAQAYLIAEQFLDGAPSAMVSGDNIFFGHGLPDLRASAYAQEVSGKVYGCRVADPQRCGVVGLDDDGRVTQTNEKLDVALSNCAVTGLYFLDSSAADRARGINPSPWGELETETLLESYLAEGALSVETMGRGYAWRDTGTHVSLLDVANFVRTLQSRQRMQTGCPEEIAYGAGWINDTELAAQGDRYAEIGYGAYLQGLVDR